MLAMLNMELDMRRQSCGLHGIDMVILHAKIGSAMLLSPEFITLAGAGDCACICGAGGGVSGGAHTADTGGWRGHGGSGVCALPHAGADASDEHEAAAQRSST